VVSPESRRRSQNERTRASSHASLFMFSKARQNKTPENGSTATNNTARVISPGSSRRRNDATPAAT
jgi:hypothetical protein